MADDSENQTNDLFQPATLLADILRRTIDPADRLGKSFAALRVAADSVDIEQSSAVERPDALAADLRSLDDRPLTPSASETVASEALAARSPRPMLREELDPQTRPASAAVPDSGLSQLPKLFAGSATRNGQQEQTKLVREQLAEQKRTNEYLQTIAGKNSQDTLGP